MKSQRLTEEQKKIVETYHDYAVNCMKEHELPMDECYDLVMLKLCELVLAYGNTKQPYYYHQRIHMHIHHLVDKLPDESRFIELIQVRDESYYIDEDLELYIALDKLKELNDRYKYVFVMNILGYSFKEISSILSISTQRVRQIYNKVCRMLRNPIIWRGIPYRTPQFEYHNISDDCDKINLKLNKDSNTLSLDYDTSIDILNEFKVLDDTMTLLKGNNVTNLGEFIAFVARFNKDHKADSRTQTFNIQTNLNDLFRELFRKGLVFKGYVNN